ncbi:MAG: LamB/YcsF family protein [Candidatus Gastranaerophilaceae bacterium]
MQELLERKQIKNIDFNCDLAQSFGIYKNNAEAEILDYVSSVNISCGFHAGDPMVIKNALLQAKEKNIVVGAHIGFDDIQGFGYREMQLSEEEIEALVIYQVGAIQSFAKTFGLEIEHVRPHGAMYKQAATDFSFACNIAKAIKKCSSWLVYYGATGDVTKKVGEHVGITVAQEVFLNKIYNADGSIDFDANENSNFDFNINRLKRLLSSSEIDNNIGGKTIIEADSIHFTNKYENSVDIIKNAKNLITPEPVNYIKVKNSGWAE